MPVEGRIETSSFQEIFCFCFAVGFDTAPAVGAGVQSRKTLDLLNQRRKYITDSNHLRSRPSVSRPMEPAHRSGRGDGLYRTCRRIHPST